jgi:hypothetical protein
MSNVREQAVKLVKSLSDKQLIDAFIEIISRPKSAENNSVRIWLIDEIESRFEDIAKALEDFYAQGVDDGLTYDERLTKFIKEKVNV